jgi:hypothetical protein
MIEANNHGKNPGLGEDGLRKQKDGLLLPWILDVDGASQLT